MNLTLQIILLILAVSQLESKRDIVIELLYGNITVPDSEYAKTLNYIIYDKKAIYVDFTLNKNVTQFDIAIKVSLIKKDNRRSKFLNFQLDGCKSMGGGLKANVLKFIYGEIYRVTNIPKQCPFLTNKLYFFKNFTVKDELLPLVVPAVEWQMDVDLLIGNVSKCKAVLTGRFRKL